MPWNQSQEISKSLGPHDETKDPCAILCWSLGCWRTKNSVVLLHLWLCIPKPLLHTPLICFLPPMNNELNRFLFFHFPLHIPCVVDLDREQSISLLSPTESPISLEVIELSSVGPTSLFLCYGQAVSDSTVDNIQTHTHTLTGTPFSVFHEDFFPFLQKNASKRKKQDFLLKVHLFFNMKTLIGLVWIPHAVVSEVLW